MIKKRIQFAGEIFMVPVFGPMQKSKSEIIFSYTWFKYFVRLDETEFSGVLYDFF